MLLSINQPIGLEMKPAPKRSKEVVKRTVFDWLTACFETREVDPQEIDLVWPTHRNKWLRPEVEAKLKQLNLNDPIHRELHHLVSLSLGATGPSPATPSHALNCPDRRRGR